MLQSSKLQDSRVPNRLVDVEVSLIEWTTGLQDQRSRDPEFQSSRVPNQQVDFEVSLIEWPAALQIALPSRSPTQLAHTSASEFCGFPGRNIIVIVNVLLVSTLYFF